MDNMMEGNMNKTTAKKAVGILIAYQKQMTEHEMAWVLFQVLGNVPLDKLQTLVKEWYSKDGKIKDAENWVVKQV